MFCLLLKFFHIILVCENIRVSNNFIKLPFYVAWIRLINHSRNLKVKYSTSCRKFEIAENNVSSLTAKPRLAAAANTYDSVNIYIP